MVNKSNSDFFFPYKYVREPAAFGSSTTNISDSPLWDRPGAPVFGPIMPPADSLDALMKAWPLSPDDILTKNHRCGRDGWKPSPRTETADVIAGDDVGFSIERYTLDGSQANSKSYNYIGHIGPGLVYIAKKPDGVELSQWDGDGDWVKIDYHGPASNDSWSLFNKKEYNCTHAPHLIRFLFTDPRLVVTIPRTTPPGQYLLRVEQIYPSEKNWTQFYVNCAQINIIGPGGGALLRRIPLSCQTDENTGKPTQFAKFPGAYKADDPGLVVPDGEEIEHSTLVEDVKWVHGFSSYVPPGPPVWSG